MQIKTIMRYDFSLIRRLTITTDNNCWWGCGEITLLVGTQMVQRLWKTVENSNPDGGPDKPLLDATTAVIGQRAKFLKRVNTGLPYNPGVPFLVTYPGLKTYSHTKTCTWLFSAILFISTQNWETTKCPSTNEWINKHDIAIQWNVVYYSTIKRNEVLIHAATWMNFENIIQGERSQTQKVTYYMIHLCEGSRISKSIVTESRLVFA